MQIKTTVRSLWKFISLAQIKMTHNHDCDHRERMKSLPLCGYEQGLFQTVKGKKKTWTELPKCKMCVYFGSDGNENKHSIEIHLLPIAKTCKF